jgi:hypothetical protein
MEDAGILDVNFDLTEFLIIVRGVPGRSTW